MHVNLNDCHSSQYLCLFLIFLILAFFAYSKFEFLKSFLSNFFHKHNSFGSDSSQKVTEFHSRSKFAKGTIDEKVNEHLRENTRKFGQKTLDSHEVPCVIDSRIKKNSSKTVVSSGKNCLDSNAARFCEIYLVENNSKYKESDELQKNANSEQPASIECLNKNLGPKQEYLNKITKNKDDSSFRVSQSKRNSCELESNTSSILFNKTVSNFEDATSDWTTNFQSKTSNLDTNVSIISTNCIPMIQIEETIAGNGL